MKQFTLALVVVLAACSPITALQNPSGTVIRAGMTKDEVRAAWGVPTNETDLPRLFFETDVWQYDFATVFFIQNNIVEKIAPRAERSAPRTRGPAVDQAGAGGR